MSTYTGIIRNCSVEQNDANKRKRSKLTLIAQNKDLNTPSTNTSNTCIAYLYDEWCEIMQFLWKTKFKNTTISITLNNIGVDNIGSFCVDLYHMKMNAFIEFKTNLHRICGTNGIHLSKENISNIMKDLTQLNKNYLQSKMFNFYPLCEIFEISKQANVCGYITKVGEIKPINSHFSIHKYSQQIRIRDLSLSSSSFDFEIMLFSHLNTGFPDCFLLDIIEFNNLTIKWRTGYHSGFFQGTGALNENICKWKVINAQNASLRCSNINNCKLNNLDQYLSQNLSQFNCNNTNNNNNEITVHVANNNNDLKVNNDNDEDNILKYNNLSDIGIETLKEKERLNLVVMITGRILMDDENENENENTFEFYWILWDGSNCDKNQHLLTIYDAKPITNKFKKNNEDNCFIGNSYSNPQIIGSHIKMLISPDYQTAILCYNDINVGNWVYLKDIFYDKAKKILIYDQQTQIITPIKTDSYEHKIKNNKLDNLYYNIFKQVSVVTCVSNINPHHQYQSYSLIRTILSIKKPNMRFRIRGKVQQFYPQNVEKFTTNMWNGYELIFALCVMDCSGSKINIIFVGKDAQLFLNINEANKKDFNHIKQCMNILMDEKNIVDICIRSYKVKDKLLIAYKGFDTVLIK